MRLDAPDRLRPGRALPGAEKARLARRFRRMAAATDLLLLLDLAALLVCKFFPSAPMAGAALLAIPLLSLLALPGLLMTYHHCPFCGRLMRRWDWTAKPFLWHFWTCPDCDFTPRWDREHLQTKTPPQE